MSKYIEHNFHGKTVLLVRHETANFDGTFKALAGVLNNGETIEQWESRCRAKRLKSFKEYSAWKINQIKNT